MPNYGYHIDPPLAAIPAALAELGATAFQTTLREPTRLSKEGVPDADDQAGYLAALAADGPLWGMVHSSLLTNLASTDPRIRNASAGTLANDANLARRLGLAGVCFHVGYQKGHDTRDDAHLAAATKLGAVAAKLEPGAAVWLENGCEGAELGQTIAEIGQVVRASSLGPDQLGVVLDTCHLHVAGFDLAEVAAADRLAAEIDAAGLWPYLRALHLNDAREACGSHRDRHAIPGQGTINAGLRRLCGHPAFAALPAILEMGIAAATEGIRYLSQEPDAPPYV
jgi:deoxyribonuclease-4